MSKLVLSNLVKKFNVGTVNEKIALDQIDFKLHQGDFVTIIGGNGAGKSTMLNAIAGIYPIDSGRIDFNSVDVTNLPEHKRAAYIGRVFQDPMMGTASEMTIEENLAMAARRGEKRKLSKGITNSERKNYVHVLKQLGLGLEGRLKNKVGLLSGGQRQALTLLMATINQPEILLLDEHSAALDPTTAQKVLKLSDKLIKENNLTAIMVTHNMKDALALGNRLIMLHEGKIVVDIPEVVKSTLQVKDLLDMFQKVAGDLTNDRMLLI